MKPLNPPKHLSREAKREWRVLQDEYGIVDRAGLLLLTRWAEALDRLRQAQATLEEHGKLTIQDRYGQEKAHPALKVENDAHLQMLRCLKDLNLDIEPLKPLGRPPGS